MAEEKRERVDQTMIRLSQNMVQAALMDYVMKMCPDFNGYRDLHWTCTDPWNFVVTFEGIKKECLTNKPHAHTGI